MGDPRFGSRVEGAKAKTLGGGRGLSVLGCFGKFQELGVEKLGFSRHGLRPLRFFSYVVCQEPVMSSQASKGHLWAPERAHQASGWGR